MTTGRVGVELEVIRFARIPTPHDYVFRPPGRGPWRWWSGFRAGDDAIDGPCLAFVLRHPTAGVLLVDSGLHPKSHHSLEDFGPIMRIVFRHLEPVGPPFDQALRERGVEPSDVEHVVMTHLHVDHTSGMRLLPNARFTCAAAEWHAATARGAALKGYVRAHLPDDSRMKMLDLERDGVPHGPFPHTLDLLGDGAVHLIATPGHTPGHLSVLAHVSGRGDVLLVGDAAYTTQSIDKQQLPLITDDDNASRRTLSQLHDFTRARPDIVVIPTHDPVAWQHGHEAHHPRS